MEIGKLFTAIGLSIQQAQEILSLQDVERYMRYFKKKDSDSVLPNESNTALSPKAIRFSLKSKEKDKYIDVPLAAMTSHETIGLKQVKVTISGNVYEDAKTKKVLMNVESSQPESTDIRNGTIELIFESAPQSEGQARATQKMLDHIDF